MSKIIEVESYERRLNYVFEQTKDLPSDPQIQAHWAKYLCVLSAGYLETSVRAILGYYAKDKSSPFVVNYVKSQLDRNQSANMDRILTIVKSFNAEWARQLQEQTDGELSAAVNSIVHNRHRIAHGQDATSVTIVSIRAWHQDAVKVVKLLEELCIDS